MGRRSRSKSPSARRRERDRSRDKERERRRKRSKERERRRSPPRRRSRSASRSRSPRRAPERPPVSAADLEGKTVDEQEMMRAMGFCTFDTTKGKKVAGNDVGGVHVILKRKYRQYMNRKGGFNRPLDFVA